MGVLKTLDGGRQGEGWAGMSLSREAEACVRMGQVEESFALGVRRKTPLLRMPVPKGSVTYCLHPFNFTSFFELAAAARFYLFRAALKIGESMREKNTNYPIPIPIQCTFLELGSSKTLNCSHAPHAQVSLAMLVRKLEVSKVTAKAPWLIQVSVDLQLGS